VLYVSAYRNEQLIVGAIQIGFIDVLLTYCRDGTGSPGHRVSDFNRVGSRVSVSDPMFDQVLCFNMRVYRGVVSTE